MCPLYVLGVRDKLILNIGGIILIRKKLRYLTKTYLPTQVSTLNSWRANPDIHTLRSLWVTS